MDAWKLPTSLCVSGTDYKIRTDFRVVLDILEAMNDPDLFLPDASEEEIALVRSDTMVQILYEDYQTIPPEDFAEACEKALDFIDMGMKDDGKKKPHSMDWQQDAQIIIPAINRVQGCEIRALPYLHWWTFWGAYMEIGDCLFSQVVNIRQKKAKHKKLEKWEKEFWNANKDLITLQKKISVEQKKEMDNLEKWL